MFPEKQPAKFAHNSHFPKRERRQNNKVEPFKSNAKTRETGGNRIIDPGFPKNLPSSR